ncbi:hypothetical protein HOLleu_23482 [Holothuria leucospilota]|uniref:EGF-like domain-containing protein n=1 Tax=Holothuria leucospilota TaxID=206669 RepID=A0A9Q1BV35_HOLLE|nr:hypothetical protein HOLleu_23482 [Holothuria leucospilota]
MNAQCACLPGFYGNGVNCTRFHDCQDLFDAGYTAEGVYTLKPSGWSGPPFDVYCKEGWMVGYGDFVCYFRAFPIPTLSVTAHVRRRVRGTFLYCKLDTATSFE